MRTVEKGLFGTASREFFIENCSRLTTKLTAIDTLFMCLYKRKVFVEPMNNSSNNCKAIELRVDN